MNHFAIHLILMQHCKSTILQLKKRINCGLDIQVGVTSSPSAFIVYFNKCQFRGQYRMRWFNGLEYEIDILALQLMVHVTSTT